MITELLESKPSSESVLDYNEEKCWRGTASVVMSKNMANSGPRGVYREILGLENNPDVSSRVRSRSFHMAVNPSETDMMAHLGGGPSDNLAAEYIQKIMEGLGMGNQPYIIYRHDDIGRPHYHVVSTRVKPDGHLVPNNYWKYKINNLQRSYADEFGYVPGKAETPETQEDTVQAAQVKDSMPKKYRQGMRNVKDAARAIFEWALSLPFRTALEFQALLRSMNIGIKTKKLPKGETVMYLQGLDDRGRVVRGKGLADHMTAVGGLERIEARLKENRLREHVAAGDLPAIRAVSEWAASKAATWREYEDMMSEVGIKATMTRNRGTKDIKKVVLVVMRNGTVADSEFNDIDVGLFREMEKSGRWRRARRGRPSDTDRRSLTVEEMSEAKAIAKSARVAARKKGASKGAAKDETIQLK